MLKAMYGTIFIPREVYTETVERGKEKKIVDAGIIEKAVGEGLIEVKELSKAQEMEAERLCSLAAIGRGEAEAIVLARDSKSELVIDDAVALGVAKLYSLKTLWTTTLIMEAVRRGVLTRQNAKRTIEDLVTAGYRLAEDVLVGLLRELG